MNYSEEEFLPISALQHMIFCERQCALIHIEQTWDENRLTAEGCVLHERVHEAGEESRGGVRIERGAAIHSFELGISGKADVVEYHRLPEGAWRPFPVEYKRGKPKPDECDKVQLCAQAMCIEEMLGIEVPAGAIFYGEPRRRLAVSFDRRLRNLTARTARKLHEMVDSGITPPAPYEKKCRNCSLFERCMPKAVRKRVGSYIERMIESAGCE